MSKWGEHARSSTSRRNFLTVGALAGLGLGDLFRLQSAFAAVDDTDGTSAAPRAPEPRATSIINIFLPGGMAHQDTFDPKPYAPIEYRGGTETIQTAVPGVLLGSHLQRTAAIADRISIIRSFSHGEAAHERGVHNMLTGYRPSPALVYP
ncbi:MAG: DUF1501 domain-containing protein, partial [Planctomycetota bacterium]